VGGLNRLVGSNPTLSAPHVDRAEPRNRCSHPAFRLLRTAKTAKPICRTFASRGAEGCSRIAAAEPDLQQRLQHPRVGARLRSQARRRRGKTNAPDRETFLPIRSRALIRLCAYYHKVRRRLSTLTNGREAEAGCCSAEVGDEGSRGANVAAGLKSGWPSWPAVDVASGFRLNFPAALELHPGCQRPR
jgi:hypothetical protein